MARDMIDAGADAVIGSHPHVLQEFDRGKPIAYSIGNFLFPDYVKGLDMGFEPFIIKDNQIVKQDKAYEKRQLNYLESLSFGVNVDGHSIRQAVRV
ncbi:CapA family protein [Paenibacillus sp. LHD-38]|uniref:CapA family protein n=1 Tax=Paenibacillus sp. LHD-38 TaxID=3072143 RepID=UPI00280ED5DF|nr:CapA family protein [Paenibacillus sp. LHD-38]MDQ8738010.1 CapA family protein [Paenibacillus sp. LHD-38]